MGRSLFGGSVPLKCGDTNWLFSNDFTTTLRLKCECLRNKTKY